MRRREFLTAGLGLLAAGCAGKAPAVLRPLPPRRDYGTHTRPRTSSLPTYGGGSASRAPSGALTIVPRTYWTNTQPIVSRVNPMGRVSRITVHHEGSDPLDFDDVNRTVEHLRNIRQIHVEGRGWGDVGYHYVIDRAGRVWEARPVRYQGAHVNNHNEQNLGVMCLGNFEEQTPTTAQFSSLQRTVGHMMRWYRVPVSGVFTHRELMSTVCPGRWLQPQMVALRQSGALA